MRGKWLCVLTIGLSLTLCACGSMAGSDGEEQKSTVQLLQEEYQTLTECDMTAALHCDGETTVEDYTMRCHWSAEGTSTVEILSPELLSGVRAELEQGALTLAYDDISLAAGTVSAEELSPVQVLPAVMGAIREGYVLEKGTESVDGEDCLRLLFDVSGNQSDKLDYIVWFGSGHLPVKAEILSDGTTLYTVTFTEFD